MDRTGTKGKKHKGVKIFLGIIPLLIAAIAVVSIVLKQSNKVSVITVPEPQADEIIAKGNRITWVNASVTHPDDYATNIIGFHVKVRMLSDNTNGVDGYGAADENGHRFAAYALVAAKGQHDETDYNENTFTSSPDESYEHYADEELGKKEIVQLGVGTGHFVIPNLANGKDVYEPANCAIDKAGDVGIMTFKSGFNIFDEGDPWLTFYGYTADFEILGIDWILGEPEIKVDEEPWEKVEVEKFFDVSTVEDESKQNGSNYIDITVPKDGKERHPVILWIHGGGWSSCSRKDVILSNTRDYFLAHGYAFASVEYTLSKSDDPSNILGMQSEKQGKQMIYDVKLAIRFLRANAEKYKLDTDFICAMGESAGAHLSLLAGTTNGSAEHEDLTMGWADYSSDIQASVSCSTPTDLRGVTAHGLREKMSAIALSMAVTGADTFKHNPLHIGKNSDRVLAEKFMSPYDQVTEAAPPAFLMHGKADATVPFSQSEGYIEKAEGIMQNEIRLSAYEDAVHVDKMYFDSYAQYTEVYEFVNTYYEQALSK